MTEKERTTCFCFINRMHSSSFSGLIYFLWLLNLNNSSSFIRYVCMILTLDESKKKKNETDVSCVIFQLVYLCKYKCNVTDRLTLTIVRNSENLETYELFDCYYNCDTYIYFKRLSYCAKVIDFQV